MTQDEVRLQELVQLFKNIEKDLSLLATALKNFNEGFRPQNLEQVVGSMSTEYKQLNKNGPWPPVGGIC
jgi:hypothetical protein